MSKELLTVAEAAVRLAVSPRQVRRHCQQGSLTAAMHGRDWLIKAADLESFQPAPVGNPQWVKSTPLDDLR